ncbi:MAG: Fe-S cluster assembly ATPase SufC [Verrucomicrobiota bacterium]|nr:Fe-S cluster assembly ATPase SufC [Verrucomicrobiota bacterium]
MIEIISLTVSVKDKKILQRLNLSIGSGEVHALMGPNGAGKSTLARVLAGDPLYEIEGGEIWFRGENLLAMSPEERSYKGLFVSFQYPPEIAGVSNREFLRAAVAAKRKARGEEPLGEADFLALLEEKRASVEMRAEFFDRNLNEGFSGGEKKRNEIVQLSLLDPSFALLDETDSGLDIDALRVVAQGVNQMRTPERSFLLITHYQRLLDLIVPDRIHVLVGGAIVQSGGRELAAELERTGYESLSV